MDTPGNTPSKKVVTISTGRAVDELLRDLYVGQRRTQQEIADALGVSRSLVKAWLAEYGISREDRDQLEPLVSA